MNEVTGQLAAAQALATSLVDEAGVNAQTPGVAIGLFSGGTLQGSVCRGMARLGEEQPITVDTVFDLGSVAKQIWAAAAIVLSDDGRIDLDEDIRTRFPELSLSERVTWRQCLRHTSGLRDYLVAAYSLDLDWAQLATQDLVLSAISRQSHTDFAPGSRMQYCNSGYVLIGSLIGRVLGIPSPEALRELVLRGLGMHSSRVRAASHRSETALAPSYEPLERSWVEQIPYESVFGDGGVLAPLTDLGPWLAFIEDGRGLPPGVREELVQPTELPSGTVPYGAGVTLHTRAGRPMIGHSGRMYGYRSWVSTDLRAGWSVALLANRPDLPLEEWGTRLLETVSRASVRVPAEVPSGWFLVGEDSLAVIELSPLPDGSLRGNRFDGEGEADYPSAGPRVWGTEGNGIRQETDGQLFLLDWRSGPQVLTRTHGPQQPEGGLFPGDYVEEETGAAVTITATGQFILPGRPAEPLLPLGGSVFGAAGLTMAQHEDALRVRLRTGSVLRFVLSGPVERESEGLAP